MFTCEQVAERLSDELDGELGETEQRLVKWHLSGCHRCVQVQCSLRRTVGLLARLRPTVPTVQYG